MNWLHDALEGIRRGREHRAAIARNMVAVAELTAESVRITQGPGGKCYELPDGQLVTLRNEQPASSSMLHTQAWMPLLPEDAEDFYGWSPS